MTRERGKLRGASQRLVFGRSGDETSVSNPTPPKMKPPLPQEGDDTQNLNAPVDVPSVEPKPDRPTGLTGGQAIALGVGIGTTACCLGAAGVTLLYAGADELGNNIPFLNLGEHITDELITATAPFLSPTFGVTLTLEDFTSTPASDFEKTFLETIIKNNLGSDTVSDFLAGWNKMGDERGDGVSKVTVEDFEQYADLRLQLYGQYGEVVLQIDPMFAQLFLPVGDLKDRGLDFQKRSGGLGFSLEDFSVLRTLTELQGQQGPLTGQTITPISRQGEDGLNRAWTLVKARDFEKVIIRYIEEWLVLNNIDRNDPLTEDLRRQLFEKIVWGDLHVRAADDGDNNWKTILDGFFTCKTHETPANARQDQNESARGVTFDPDAEIAGNNIEEERYDWLDSDNTVLISMVGDVEGQILRIEIHTLANPDDILREEPQDDSDGVWVEGGRWVPCAKVEAPKPPVLPEITPTLPVPPSATAERPPATNQPPPATTQPPLPPATATPPVATPIPNNPHDIPTATPSALKRFFDTILSLFRSQK